MGRGVLAAGAVGFMLALALGALAYLLFFSGGEPPRTPTVREPVRPAATQPTARRTAAPELATARRTPVRRSAQAPAPSRPATDRPLTDDELRAEIHRILLEYDKLAQAVAGAQGRIGQEQIRSLREREQKISALVARLAALGPRAAPLLLEVLEQDGRAGRLDRQTLIVRALGQMQASEGIEALGQALDLTEQWGLRMAIVSQLAQHGGAQGLEILAGRLAVEPDARVRGAILKFVGQQRSTDAAQLAARLARGDQDPNVRIAAVRALGEAGQVEIAAPVLEELARTGDNVAVRQNAVQVYGRLLGERAVPLLEDLVRADPNIRIRSVAILSLQEIGSNTARAALEATAQDPTQPDDVRARARGALAAIERMRRGEHIPVGTRMRGLKPVPIEGLKPIGGK